MSDDTKRIIEINGIKVEVDLRTARVVDTLKVGSRVKCLERKYESNWDTYPGVVVGFHDFIDNPSIVVAYLTYDDLKFKTITSGTKDFQIVADIDDLAIEINKERFETMIDRQITKHLREIEELEAKKAFFVRSFGKYFKDID